jgi:hypothetical protein
MSEIPVHPRPRRLADWINPTGARKVHSLVDKVYQRKNLEMAWEKVKANRGSGGVDGQNLEAFAAQLDPQLERLQSELKDDTYQPQPVRQVQIPKAGKPGEFRTPGIPTIYDRVCQQALLNRLEPIFEPILDEANFGYRRKRSTKDAMRKVCKEIRSGREWIVDGDLKDFFGSVDHEKLLTLGSAGSRGSPDLSQLILKAESSREHRQCRRLLRRAMFISPTQLLCLGFTILWRSAVPSRTALTMTNLMRRARPCTIFSNRRSSFRVLSYPERAWRRWSSRGKLSGRRPWAVRRCRRMK